MTALVTKHIELLSTAPAGVEKLRMLFRRLAVNGRLSTTGANASAQSEWRNATFGQVFSLEYGENLPAPKRSGTGEFPVYGSNGVVGSHNECCVRAPCIVVGRKGSAGAVNICEHEGCWVTDVAYSCVPPSDVALRFAFVLFQTLGLDELGKGIKPGLSRSEAYALPVSIPPLAEQRRIVAKVDELMALCDRLEAEQADAEAAHAKLVEALLASLTQARDAADFRASWQQLAEHFHTLFITEASIDALERSAIQLALMGRMNTAAETDAPAAEFVAAAKKEKRLRAAAADRKRMAFSNPESPPVTFTGFVPERWAACRVDDVTECLDYLRKPVNKAEREGRQGDVPYYGANGPVGWIDEHLFDEDLVLVVEDETFIGRTKPFSYMVTGKSWVNNHAHVLRPLGGMSAAYLNLCLHRYDFIPLTSGTTGRRKLTQAGLNGAVVLVAPLAEQHRIVKRVDELVALCAQLRLKIGRARQHHEHLASVLVEQAVA